MLVLICGQYLRDMHASVLAGATRERSLINALHDLHGLLASRKARAIGRKHRLDYAAAFPLDLATDRLPKLAAFYAHLDSPRA
jgi:hypothetical protein